MTEGGENMIEYPSWLSSEDWDDFCNHRIEIRKPMTDRAKRRMIKQLIALHQQGHDVTALIDRAIRNGWQDVRVYDNEKVAMKPASHHITSLPDYGPRTDPDQAQRNIRELIRRVK